MTFKLKKDSVIFIMAPANIDTGGPTDLHQLAYILKKKFKKKVYMHYFSNTNKNPVHKNYKIFKIPYKKNISDLKKNVLIIPEFYKSIEISKKYKSIQKGLWWLSVDFFIFHRFVYKNHSLIRSLFKIPHKLIVSFNKLTSFYFGNMSFFKYLQFIYLQPVFVNIFKIKNINVNLAHSDYTFKILKSKKINSFQLADYIRDEYHKASKNISIKDKKNFICYNPSKSSIFFKRFMKLNSDLKFIPLINLNLKQIIYTLSKSKIYIDFGFHPGKDHLPREAAILKNCIITNKEGSASLMYNDVPIKNEFKFLEKKENFSKMRKKIDSILNSFSKELSKYKSYRKTLYLEEKKFTNQVNKIFIK